MKLSALLVLLPLIGTAAAGSLTIREAHHLDKPVSKPDKPNPEACIVLGKKCAKRKACCLGRCRNGMCKY
ncbi:Protein of unknown function [Pyronema omphalodes CBS 100304]|uniref:Uncharacterized protein n=1 Tax=Pyronema omphalodes (strain CBS 100304) TaxID=1076935 RepID=U4LX58_PYROM|nr:Protein of unknown function [Pyronema omphalodes CBS 100304]